MAAAQAQAEAALQHIAQAMARAAERRQEVEALQARVSQDAQAIEERRAGECHGPRAWEGTGGQRAKGGVWSRLRLDLAAALA